jgi:hypothetical protein
VNSVEGAQPYAYEYEYGDDYVRPEPTTSQRTNWDRARADRDPSSAASPGVSNGVPTGVVQRHPEQPEPR